MKLFAPLCAAALAALALTSSAAAIDEGVPDGDGHPNVGLLGFDFDGPGELPPFALCSGSVISDRAFLTAAHCIEVFGAGVEWVVTLEAGSPASPVATPGVFPQDFPFPITVPVERATGAVVHPQYGRGDSRYADLAVVTFSAGTFAGVTPIELPPAGLLDHLRGQSVTLVGYGTDAHLGPPSYPFVGYRRTATATVQTLTARWVRMEPAAADGAPALCYGDSASPQFLGDSNLAVSQHSHELHTCRGAVRAQRLDTALAREFLAPFLAG